jgi:hypothetical protein
VPNGLGFTRAATVGKSIRYETDYKARMATADQPRKRRQVQALVGPHSVATNAIAEKTPCIPQVSL